MPKRVMIHQYFVADTLDISGPYLGIFSEKAEALS